MRTGASLRRWAFLLPPALGLAELGAHVANLAAVVPERDWRTARELLRAELAPDDLVAFAPKWTEPLGRCYLGDDVATLARVARADASRFRRVFELSVHGGRLDEFASWPVASERRAGAVTVRALVNPSFAPVVDDISAHLGPTTMAVSLVDGAREQPCRFLHRAAESGGLGFGPAIPAERFVCPDGGPVGVSVVAVLDYSARRCIYAPRRSADTVLRLQVPDVSFGRELRGHHGLYVEAERMGDGAPVTIAFRVGERRIGHAVHRDGAGWVGFQFDTPELAGQRADLTVDISSPSADRRMYCFEATSR